MSVSLVTCAFTFCPRVTFICKAPMKLPPPCLCCASLSAFFCYDFRIRCALLHPPPVGALRCACAVWCLSTAPDARPPNKGGPASCFHTVLRIWLSPPPLFHSLPPPLRHCLFCFIYLHPRWPEPHLFDAWGPSSSGRARGLSCECIMTYSY